MLKRINYSKPQNQRSKDLELNSYQTIIFKPIFSTSQQF